MQRPTTVLHVDDDPSFLSLASTVFDRNATFETVSAASATDGLDRLDERAIDCVVSDSVRLPDGEPFVTRVRREYPDLPVILFTANDLDSAASDLDRGTVTAYVQKAGVDDFDTLLARVDSVTETPDDRQAVTDEAIGQTGGFPEADDPVVASLDLGDGWTVSEIDDWGDDNNVTESVVDTATRVTDIDGADLPPLFDSIDPEALATVVGTSPGGRERSGVQVRFPYAGLEFVVTADGVLAFRDLSESEN